MGGGEDVCMGVYVRDILRHINYIYIYIKFHA